MSAIVPLIALAAQGAIGARKAYKQREKNEEVERYNEELDKIEEQERVKAQKDRQKQALARAVGDTTIWKPRKLPNVPDRPDSFDPTKYDVAQGVTRMVGELGGQLEKDIGNRTRPDEYTSLFEKLRDRRKNRANNRALDVGLA